MLQLTRDGEYAVRAILHLSSQPVGQVTLVNEIAEAQDVPKSYLSKIMQHLVKSGLVKSRRGARGGFILAKPADQITLREAIEAIEGPIHLNVCLIKRVNVPGMRCALSIPYGEMPRKNCSRFWIVRIWQT